MAVMMTMSEEKILETTILEKYISFKDNSKNAISVGNNSVNDDKFRDYNFINDDNDDENIRKEENIRDDNLDMELVLEMTVLEIT